MVSSKCCQVVSPSPFKFLAALIPPCAQTECDRFTGTTENRSTLPPFSAILMTAASPASPPPTTMTLGLFAILQISRYSVALEPVSIPLASVGLIDCCGVERNLVKLPNPTPLSTKKNARHAAKKRLRAFSPETIPHFAQNNQIP